MDSFFQIHYFEGSGLTNPMQHMDYDGYLDSDTRTLVTGWSQRPALAVEGQKLDGMDPTDVDFLESTDAKTKCSLPKTQHSKFIEQN